jgi:hypothetical protein
MRDDAHDLLFLNVSRRVGLEIEKSIYTYRKQKRSGMKYPGGTRECEFQFSSEFKLFPDVSLSHVRHCKRCCCNDGRHRVDTADRRDGLDSIEIHLIRLNSPCCPYQQGFL